MGGSDLVASAGLRVMISSPLERSLATRIGQMAEVGELLYAPELLPPTRYPNDHGGDPEFRLNEAQQRTWDAMVARADVLFGYPREGSAELAEALLTGTSVRFVQGTSAGMGAHIKRAQLPQATLERVAFASAAGVHGGTLAEFAFLGMLWIRKDAPHLFRIREERRWSQYTMGELQGSTSVIVGMGHIGRAVALRASAFGMRVLAVARHPDSPELADQWLAMSQLGEAFEQADQVVLTLPLTELTRGLVGARELARLRSHAIFCNVGRGAVVDEPALVQMLQEHRLAGAVLDVFEQEPLPADHPLWAMENVFLSPHTAALSAHENERIVELFCENLRRLAAGERLLSQVKLAEFY